MNSKVEHVVSKSDPRAKTFQSQPCILWRSSINGSIARRINANATQLDVYLKIAGHSYQRNTLYPFPKLQPEALQFALFQNQLLTRYFLMTVSHQLCGLPTDRFRSIFKMADHQVTEVVPEETPVDVVSGDEAAGLTSGVDTETEKEGTKKDIPKKENVLPKRTVIGAKRPGTVPASSATKGTAASTTRTTGGLSKPPTRPLAGSAVRKTASSATAPTASSTSHRPTPSISSIDEKKSATAAKRTSLASSTQGSPSKATTTTASARKPTTTISSSTAAKPLVPKTATGNGSISSRSPAISKAPAGGAVADAKKRLSTIAGSLSSSVKPTTTRPTASSSAQAASTKEIEELKAKLQDSETRVEELQAEISASQEKLITLGKQMEVEANAVSEAELQIRTQHHDIVEKLHATHKADVESLQAQLEEAKAAHASANEMATNSASAATSSLEKHKTEHASALAAISSELSSTKDAHANAVTAKEAEIADLKSLLEKTETEIKTMNEKIKSLQAEHDAKSADFDAKSAAQTTEHVSALETLKKSLGEEHESSIAALKLAHHSELEKGTSSASESYETQLKELKAKHQSASNDLQKQLEAAVASQTALAATHKESSDAQLKEHSVSVSKLESELATLKATTTEDKKALAALTAELTTLTAKLDSAEKTLAVSTKQHETAQKELAASSKKYEELVAKNAKDAQSLSAATAEVAKYKSEVISLQKMMDAFDEEGKSKDDVHNKIKADLAVTAKSLDDKTKEIATLQEKHRKELETISADYQKEIEALEGNSGFKDKFEELDGKHKEFLTSHTAALATHAAALEALEKVWSTYGYSFNFFDTNKNAQEHSTKVKELSTKHDDLAKSQTNATSVQALALEKAQKVYLNYPSYILSMS